MQHTRNPRPVPKRADPLPQDRLSLPQWLPVKCQDSRGRPAEHRATAPAPQNCNAPRAARTNHPYQHPQDAGGRYLSSGELPGSHFTYLVTTFRPEMPVMSMRKVRKEKLRAPVWRVMS